MSGLILVNPALLRAGLVGKGDVELESLAVAQLGTDLVQNPAAAGCVKGQSRLDMVGWCTLHRN